MSHDPLLSGSHNHRTFHYWHASFLKSYTKILPCTLMQVFTKVLSIYATYSKMSFSSANYSKASDLWFDIPIFGFIFIWK